MSRTPATYTMTVVRGSSWQDDFVYMGSDGAPIDCTGLEARMQVRALADRYGISGKPPVLELTTTGANPLLAWDTAADGRLVIDARPDQHAELNPQNLKKAKYAYSVELYRQAQDGEYVVPFIGGVITVLGEVTR